MPEDVRAETTAAVVRVVAREGSMLAAGDVVLLLGSATTQTPVLARGAGRLVRIVVREGEVVQEGDLLATMDPAVRRVGAEPAPGTRPPGRASGVSRAGRVEGLRIVALNGSERRGGNTAWALEHVAARAAVRGVVVDVVELSSARFGGCGPCGDCNQRTEPCAVDDDVRSIVERMVAGDAVLYAAPVHGFGLSGLMQQFIERAGVGHLRFDRPLTNKVAGVLVTGRRYAHTDVHAQLVHNAMLNRMILVGSGFPAVLHAGASGEAAVDAEGIDAVDRMVDRMIDMMEMVAEHRAMTGRRLGVPRTTERVRL